VQQDIGGKIVPEKALLAGFSQIGNLDNITYGKVIYGYKASSP
jgi:hypothetical protein